MTVLPLIILTLCKSNSVISAFICICLVPFFFHFFFSVTAICGYMLSCSKETVIKSIGSSFMGFFFFLLSQLVVCGESRQPPQVKCHNLRGLFGKTWTLRTLSGCQKHLKKNNYDTDFKARKTWFEVIQPAHKHLYVELYAVNYNTQQAKTTNRLLGLDLSWLKMWFLSSLCTIKDWWH